MDQRRGQKRELDLQDVSNEQLIKVKKENDSEVGENDWYSYKYGKTHQQKPIQNLLSFLSLPPEIIIMVISCTTLEVSIGIFILMCS